MRVISWSPVGSDGERQEELTVFTFGPGKKYIIHVHLTEAMLHKSGLIN